MWLLHHYLFVRVPLIRPDRFLDRTVDFVRWIYTLGFV
jgi:putative peptide zinc metalloprotease protein